MQGLFRRGLAVILVLAFTACGGGSSSKAPSTTSATTIGASGGTVTSAGITLDVPPGALTSDTALSITATDQLGPSEAGPVTKVVKFEPAGLHFAQPVTVTFQIPDGVDQASIYWSREDGSGYDPLPTYIAGKTLVATIMHFSSAFLGTPVGVQGPPGPAGPKGLTWRGAYDPGASYVVDDAVEYAGSAYIAIANNSGTPPPSAAWSLLAAKGDVGDPGPAATNTTGLNDVVTLAGRTDFSGTTVTIDQLGVTTTTAADGSFSFANVPYGMYSVSFKNGAYAETAPSVLVIPGSAFLVDGAVYTFQPMEIAAARRLVQAAQSVTWTTTPDRTTLVFVANGTLYSASVGAPVPVQLAPGVSAIDAVSGDGKFVTFQKANGTGFGLIPTTGGTAVDLGPGSQWPDMDSGSYSSGATHFLAEFPGKFLFQDSTGTYWLMTTDGGRVPLGHVFNGYYYGSTPITYALGRSLLVYAAIENGATSVKTLSLSTSTVRTVVTDALGNASPAPPFTLSSDGAAIYVWTGSAVSSSATLKRVDLASGASVVLASNVDSSRGYRVSSDGSRSLAFSSSGALVLGYSSGASPVTLLVDSGIWSWQTSLSPDGTRVYVISNGMLSSVAAMAGASRTTLGPATAAPVFSPDGHYGVYQNSPSSCSQASFVVFDTTTLLTTATVNMGAQSYNCVPTGVLFSPDSSKAYVYGSGLTMVDCATGAVSQLATTLATNYSLIPKFTPDSTRILFVTNDSVPGTLASAPVGSPAVSVLAQGVNTNGNASWVTPDSRFVVVATASGVVVSPVAGGPTVTLGDGNSWFTVTADGYHLVYSNATGSTLGVAAIGGAGTDVGSVLQWAWVLAPDGSRLVYVSADGTLKSVGTDGTGGTVLGKAVATCDWGNMLSTPRLALSPSGARVAFVQPDGEVAFAPVAGGVAQVVAHGPNGWTTACGGGNATYNWIDDAHLAIDKYGANNPFNFQDGLYIAAAQ
jgi:hypothetical protein